MTRTKIIFAFMALSLLAGCGATIVSTKRNLSNDPNAPVASGPDGGEIKFLNEGLRESVAQEQRQDAYRQMKDYCHGPYKIVSEETKWEPYSVSAWVNPTPAHVVHVKFECLPEGVTTTDGKTSNPKE
ncbi:MAG: hypothetical protein V1495_05405 [Pseudomonadota bacterium]